MTRREDAEADPTVEVLEVSKWDYSRDDYYIYDEATGEEFIVRPHR